MKKQDATGVVQEAAIGALYCYKKACNAIGGLLRRFKRCKLWFHGMERWMEVDVHE